MELARLAEMYGIIRIESPIAQYIKGIYATSGHLRDDKKFRRAILPDDKDIVLGTLLRDDHPVRRVMAQAYVVWYLRREPDPNDLMTQECPKFGADLLYEVKLTLDTLSHRDSATVKDPITGKRRHLEGDEESEYWGDV